MISLGVPDWKMGGVLDDPNPVLWFPWLALLRFVENELGGGVLDDLLDVLDVLVAAWSSSFAVTACSRRAITFSKFARLFGS